MNMDIITLRASIRGFKPFLPKFKSPLLITQRFISQSNLKCGETSINTSALRISLRNQIYRPFNPIIPHIRQFHSTPSASVYFRPPRKGISFFTTPLSALFNLIPDWLKIVGSFAIGTYLTVFVALPFLVFIVPPLAICAFLWMRFRRARYDSQMKKRWSLLSGSTLVYTPKGKYRRGMSPEQMVFPTLEKSEFEIAMFSLDRIYEAVVEDEQGIKTYLGIEDMNQLTLGSIESQDYSWNTVPKIDKPTGYFTTSEELMSIRTRALFDKKTSSRLATVQISMKIKELNEDFAENPMLNSFLDKAFGLFPSYVVIEVIPDSGSSVLKALIRAQKLFVFDTPSKAYDSFDGESDKIYDIKGTTRRG